MIHEKQVRQFCAIHSVNNLLQLRSNSDVCVTSDPDDDNGECTGGNGVDNRKALAHEWHCHGRVLYSSCDKSTTSSGDAERSWRVATQQEFDNIAKEITIREQLLLNGDESTLLSTTKSFGDDEGNSIGTTRKDKLSILQRIRSQHGTPFTGNYSFEVLEKALSARHVQLEFYRVPPDTKQSTTGDNISSVISAHSNTIGFIVHEKEENRRKQLSFVPRMFSHIPIVKMMLGVGQHWYAITAVKRERYCISDTQNKDNSKAAIVDSSWALIDSNRNNMPIFSTWEQLMDHLREVQALGGLVFRAFMDDGIENKSVGRL